MPAAAPSFWFVAGEASGDARAAEVMRALRGLRADVRFFGAGGGRMEALSEAPFDNWTAQAAVLGLWDVLRHYGYFRQKFRRMLADIRALRPAAVVLVDYPGFNLRLAKALRASGFEGKILYYISPQVWAWNRGRIPKMARYLDLMICVFPFEAPMYEASGLHTVFVGHPLLEALEKDRIPTPRESGLVGFFPGSREREVRRIFPVMVAAAEIIRREFPEVRFEAAAASEAHAERMRAFGEGIDVRAGTAHALMQRATAGIVCSGTATLEAAFFGLPYCLVYRIAWLTFEIGKRLVDVNALGIINILNNYRQNPPSNPQFPARPAPHVVREFIQHDATPEALAGEVIRLLRDVSAREALSREVQKITSELSAQGASERAAAALLEELSGKPWVPAAHHPSNPRGSTAM
jgi:lipid-A-disaccharide synthase